jgi:hypothetical protein
MPYRGYRRTRGYGQKLGLLNLVIRRCPRPAVGGAMSLAETKDVRFLDHPSVLDLPLRYKLVSAQATLRDLLIAVANASPLAGTSNYWPLLSSR